MQLSRFFSYPDFTHRTHLHLPSEFKLGRRISLKEISEETGIHLSTLSRVANQKASNTTIGNLEKICLFFGCKIQELVEFLPDQDDQKDLKKE
ncbi:helix-turn-helix domain-containing protein [uncultured Desulfuromusa sp.]|uniref:helix-turn-helix domain-containing protein n=1 Tax=uncultured Desulfuromusa sp. TaxID=219183 RepID=UPI0037495A92